MDGWTYISVLGAGNMGEIGTVNPSPSDIVFAGFCATRNAIERQFRAGWSGKSTLSKQSIVVIRNDVT